jgi:hypothetical protein
MRANSRSGHQRARILSTACCAVSPGNSTSTVASMVKVVGSPAGRGGRNPPRLPVSRSAEAPPVRSFAGGGAVVPSAASAVSRASCPSGSPLKAGLVGGRSPPSVGRINFALARAPAELDVVLAGHEQDRLGLVAAELLDDLRRYRRGDDQRSRHDVDLLDRRLVEQVQHALARAEPEQALVERPGLARRRQLVQELHH